MSFSQDIAKFTAKAEKAATMVFRGTSLDLFSSIVTRTPVGNKSIWKDPERAPKGYTGGRLRANWQVGFNSIMPGEIDSTKHRATMKTGQAKIEKTKVTDAVFITNNLPYAQPVEYGHSKQAPLGMVRVTIRQFKRLIEKRAREQR